jgi:hypothetical protein
MMHGQKNFKLRHSLYKLHIMVFPHWKEQIKI